MNALFLALLAIGLVLGLVAALVVWRARSAPRSPAQAHPAASGASPFGWLTTIVEAIDYARTRRAWRYRLPWILLLGERGAGKTSLVLSAGELVQLHRDSRYAALNVPGGAWTVMTDGALIDVDGEVWTQDAAASRTLTPLPRASAPQRTSTASASPAASAATTVAGPASQAPPRTDEANANWDKLLAALVDLRPERPVDGVILAVSARTLLTADADSLVRMATTAYCYLCELQDTFRFVLPVSVVVTQCDLVDGFAAFWRAQPETLRAQMFGWSAPVLAGNHTPSEWCDAAFATIDDRLRMLQLDAAARDEVAPSVAERDGMLLFPARLASLRVPLANWLDTAFRTTLDRPGHLCRGIYFTGDLDGGGIAPRDSVAFVTDLIEDKVFAERGNARVVRASAWSRSRYLRTFQVAALVVAAVLAIGLGMSGLRLHAKVRELDRVLAQLQSEPAFVGGVCPSASKVASLLMSIRQLDTRSFYWANPWSWFGHPLRTGTAQVVAGHVFADVILPGLSCRLTVRAQNLLARGQAALPATDDANARLHAARSTLNQQLRALIDLEASLGTFKHVARPYAGAATEEDMNRFGRLLNFAYGLPAAVIERDDASGLLGAALSWASTEARPNLPANLADIYAGQLNDMETRLRNALVDEASAGQQLLVDLHAGRGDPADETRQLVGWFNWTRDNWLGQRADDASRNLCGQIRSDLEQQIRQLVLTDASSGQETAAGAAPAASPYSSLLDETAAIFSPQGCETPVYAKLDALRVPPYDPLIVRVQGERIFNPTFSAEFTGLTALAQLPFMQVTRRREAFVCDAGAQTWSADALGDAGAYIAQYRGFAQRFGVKSANVPGSRPLFAQIAARQLENALNHALNDAQRPRPATTNVWPVDVSTSSYSPAPFDEQSLAQASRDLARSLGALIAIERGYQEFGFSGSYARVSHCLEQFSANRLATVGSLAVQSQLYRPPMSEVGPEFYDLGTVAVTRDYLARQVARAQVLATYAAPFVTLAQNSGNAANGSPNTQTDAYWSNSIAEVNRYVPANDPASAMGQLAALFVDRLNGMTARNCSARLQNVSTIAGGDANNLFASLGRSLISDTELRCQGADVDAFSRLFSLFDATLAGRYPFGKSGLPEATPAAVRDFFAAYALQSAGLRTKLGSLPKAQQAAVSRFFDRLDEVQKFFAATTRADGSIAVHLTAAFNVRQSAERGADQVVGWTLRSADNSASYPNGASAFDWLPGQSLALDVTWAELSRFTPYADLALPDAPTVSGRTATFAQGGMWALIRFVQGYASSQGPTTADGITLRFPVPIATVAAAQAASSPVAPLSLAQLMLTLRLQGVDTTSHASVALKLPVFPASAPRLYAERTSAHASVASLQIPTIPPLPPLPPGYATQDDKAPDEQ